jgi:hypothetical protein
VNIYTIFIKKMQVVFDKVHFFVGGKDALIPVDIPEGPEEQREKA